METIAQEALRLLKDVPGDQWIIGDFSDGKGKCCAIGHFSRLKSGNPNDYNVDNCSDRSSNTNPAYKLRGMSMLFLVRIHGIGGDLSSVNNSPTVNGYTQDNPKDRVIALLEDMVKSGY